MTYRINIFNIETIDISEHFKLLRYADTISTEISKISINDIKIDVFDNSINDELQECNVFIRLPYSYNKQTEVGLLLLQTIQRFDGIEKLSSDIEIMYYVSINDKFIYLLGSQYYTIELHDKNDTIYENIFEYCKTGNNVLIENIKTIFYNSLVNNLIKFFSQYSINVGTVIEAQRKPLILNSDLIIYTGDIETFLNSVDYNEYKKVLMFRENVKNKRARFDSIINSIFANKYPLIEIVSQFDSTYWIHIVSLTKDIFEVLFNSIVFLLNNNDGSVDLHSMLRKSKYFKDLDLEQYNKFLNALYKLQMFEKDNEKFIQSIINIFEPAK